jgi:hypothetical protein
MLGVSKLKPEQTGEGKLLPILGHGMQSMSIGYLVDAFFNKQSACPWVQTALLFWPTCSFIRNSFFMKHSWTNSFNLSFSLRVGNTCVEGKEVKCFNAIAGGEGPRLYVL